MNKTAYDWSKEFGIQIIDPDGFGERHEGRPRMDELMDIDMFNKCMCISTIKVTHPTLFKKIVDYPTNLPKTLLEVFSETDHESV